MKNQEKQNLESKNAELEKQLAAKTRDLEIEAALERVRARTMAMQHSDELSETAFILFQQFKELGENPDQATIGIINENEHVIEYWVTMYGSQVNKVFKFSIDEPNVTNKIYKAWKAKKKSLVIDLSGKALLDFTTYRASMGGAGFNPAEKRRVINVAFFSKGIINVQSNEERSAESIRLLERFAGVFESTYTRFLDLKKAEAQAREGQIQLGLERVRAAAMAMHDSAGVSDATALVFTELYKLGIDTIRCGVCIVDGEAEEIEVWSASQQGEKLSRGIGKLDMTAHPLWIYLLNAWKAQTPSFTYELKGQELADYYHIIRTAAGYHAPDNKAMYNPAAGIENETQYCNCYIFKEGCLFTFTHEPFSSETGQVLERFAAVFGLTYRRFLDLQRAEAQAREAQIELALERVRARTMAMYHSEELAETSSVLFEQLSELGSEPARISIGIMDEEKGLVNFWATDQEGDQINISFIAPLSEKTTISKMYAGWQAKLKSLIIELEGRELAEWVHFCREEMGIIIRDELLQKRRVHTVGYFSQGWINYTTHTPPSSETTQILERFATMFSYTYTRFLDLQKAEAQARESQIQLALERVRARTMAMQHSEELAETATVLFQQLLNLGISPERTIIGIPNDDTRKIEFWGTEQGGNQISTRFEYEADATYAFREIYQAWQEKRSELIVTLKGKNLEEHVNYIRNVLNMPLLVELVQEQRLLYNAFFSKGWLQIVTPDAQSKETLDILERFAGVFDGTYTRFLDLQKAEAQARESQIELSLERIRAKTMAMHNSEDVGETVAAMFDELVKLGIEKTARCGISIIDDNREMELWRASYDAEGNVYRVIGRIDMTIHPLLEGVYDAWKNNEAVFTCELTGKDQDDYFRALNDSPQYPVQFDLASLPARQTNNVFFFPEGCVYAFTIDPLSPDEVKLFKRFAGVFGQTYRRYLDLQKAEAAAREAQIEASLERVRGKAMAMRNSNDLSVTASMVFAELRNLGINPIRSGVGLVTRETRRTKIYSDTSSKKDTDLSLMGEVVLSGHPVFEGQYQAWLDKKNYFVALEGSGLASYYKLLSAGLNADLGITKKNNRKEYGHWFMFSEGFLYAWSDKSYTEEEIKILERFKNVIELTFRRYIELQKSEAIARDAVKEASLDRVRAEIASMRKRDDLERITPLIWNELTILGIPFIRCGVFIMDEEQKLIHTFLSTPDGKAIGAFHVPFDTSGNFEKMVDSWRHNMPYIDHWKEEAFSQFADTLVKQGAIASKSQYMRTLPHEGVHLNFLPFLQGMLYVGNIEPLTKDNIDLIQSVADAFSTAYARYEDFNKLEAAKQQVDNTLADLKATQTKLIQSEKMASLGELTAGIAHEIQNPLNFVNNFSEVNQEMIDELADELKAGNIEEALAIAADIKDNEQKINHHGKRADGIVKGMLQHSRTGGGEKQPTNMNALADEFLRLSYHGLRAKDKLFNAELVTHFDPNLPKLNVIGQDMGRVMLNLFNNAFYAVNQKQKALNNEYKPEVTVTTLTENGQVIIKVRDNGTGMPDVIKEKIMQPFFTTKPTGEGTGLGLSLTYDMVVKGHGGTIQVNSKEGEGSEFIISLPIN